MRIRFFAVFLMLLLMVQPAQAQAPVMDIPLMIQQIMQNIYQKSGTSEQTKTKTYVGKLCRVVGGNCADETTDPLNPTATQGFDWKKALYGTLGSIASGNFFVDLASCLPKINLNGQLNLNLNAMFGGSTQLACSADGQLKLRQNYFYNVGTPVGSLGGGGGYNQTLVGSDASKTTSTNSSNSPASAQINKDAGQQLIAQTAGEMQRNQKTSLKATTLTSVSTAIAKTGEVKLAVKAATGAMDSLSKASENCDTVIACLDVQNKLIATSLGVQVQMVELEADKAEAAGYQALAESGVYAINDKFQEVAMSDYLYALFKERPNFFYTHPDLFVETPKILAENPHLLDKRPEVKKYMMAYLQDYPEKKMALAQAWRAEPQVHKLYAELVPAQTPDQQLAGKAMALLSSLVQE